MLVIVVFVLLVTESPVIKNFFADAADTFVCITSPVQGEAYNTVSVVVYGLTDANLTVNVYIDGALAGTASADSDGKWFFALGTLAEGIHSVYADTSGLAGQVISSDTVYFEIDLTPPIVTIANPADGTYINFPVIEGSTEPEVKVTVFIDGQQAEVISDTFGEWCYYNETLPEGNHTVYASASDRAGNIGVSASHSFVLDMTRPAVLPGIFPADDMTQVPVDMPAYIYIKESSPIDPGLLDSAFQFTEIVCDAVYAAVYGTVYTNVFTDVYGEQYYGLMFKPDSLLKRSTMYSVEINPALVDVAGNPVFPRSWTFTTAGDVYSENPHGNYIDNVNTCINCHRPHRGAAPKINKPPRGYVGSLDDYCLSCHDGTAAPVTAGWSAPHAHDFQISIEGVTGTNACAACHNPHLTWTPDNPNLLQDFYLYDHNDPTNPYLPDSSEDQLCENCHSGSIKDDPRVFYIKYRYSKRHETSGSPGDYSLCLRCHDGGNAVNIAVYYSSPSGHFLAALDESPLNGHIACADCHETHGSKNIKLLKLKLGHNNTQIFEAGAVWDAGTERRFCTGCHNNMTEIYGITAGFDLAIPGHQAENSQPCHDCHGGSPIAAAHAPT